jgi:ribosomal protein S18 acetylase RimI-like enzyme
MKAKDLKILRKKLAKASKLDTNRLEGVDTDLLHLNIPKRSDDAAAAEKPETTLSIEYASSVDLSDTRFKQCLDLFEKNMAEQYLRSSWGLDMKAKEDELRHEKARYLLLIPDDEIDELAGFVHFRYDYDDQEHPSYGVIYVFEIQIDESYQRRGLGKKVMDLVEALTLQAELDKVMLTVFKANESAMKFYLGLDYTLDMSTPSKWNHPADYEILSKAVTKKK